MSFSRSRDGGFRGVLPVAAGRWYGESGRFVATSHATEVGLLARLKRESQTSFEMVKSQSEPFVLITSLSLSGNARSL